MSSLFMSPPKSGIKFPKFTNNKYSHSKKNSYQMHKLNYEMHKGIRCQSYRLGCKNFIFQEFLSLKFNGLSFTKLNFDVHKLTRK